MEQLVEVHPRLFHMAHHDAWSNIARHGLLSTEALIDKFEITGAEKSALTEQRRAESVPIEHDSFGTAIIRDNKPMTESALSRCLTDGMTPTDWYRRLNGLVFFWVRRERLDRLLGARAYRDTPHLVIEFDTARLLDAHAANVLLSPINSGSTAYNPVPRGAATFSSIEQFPYEYWRRKRGNRRNAVVELTVQYAVPDAIDFVTSAEIVRPGGGTEPLHRA